MPATKPTRISTANGTPRSEFRTATAAITAAATTTIRINGPVSWLSARPAATRWRHAHRADAGIDADRDQGHGPADRIRVEGVREAGDLAVRDVDRAGVAEHVEQRSLPDQEPGERDHERRNAEAGEERALHQADRHPAQHAGGDREVRVPAVLDVEHRHHRGRETADGADREVDLPQQQHVHDADRDQADRRDLEHQVGEVDRGEEAVVLGLEDDPDHDHAEDHAQRREIPLHEPPQRSRARVGRSRPVGAGGAVVLIAGGPVAVAVFVRRPPPR